MAGYATLTDNRTGTQSWTLRVGEDCSHLLSDVSMESATNVKVLLDCDELEYAVSVLGAANVKKRVVTYYGDEAKRIISNW